MVIFPDVPKINTTVALTTLKLSNPSWPKYLRTSSVMKRECNIAIVRGHASGHLRLILHRKPQDGQLSHAIKSVYFHRLLASSTGEMF